MCRTAEKILKTMNEPRLKSMEGCPGSGEQRGKDAFELKTW
jgi:hypothetical protein